MSIFLSELRKHVRLCRTVLLLMLLIAEVLVYAQGNVGKISVEEIDARIEKIQVMESIPENTKTQIVDIYSQTKDALALTESWKVKIVEYQSSISNAPQKIKDVDRELQMLTTNPSAPSAEATLSALEQELAQSNADINVFLTESAELQAEPLRRSERKRQIPELLAKAKGNLAEIEAEKSTGPIAGEVEELAKARATHLAVREHNKRLEIMAYDLEIQSYDIRSQLLTKRIARAVKRVSFQEKRIELLTQLVNQKLSMDARSSAAEAREVLNDLSGYSPEVRAYLDTMLVYNAELTAKRAGADGVLRKIQKVTEELIKIKEKLDELNANMLRIKERMKTAGNSNATGHLLRQQEKTLPDSRIYKRAVKQRQDDIAAAQLEQIEIREQGLDLILIEEQIDQGLESVGLKADSNANAKLREVLQVILEARVKVLTALSESIEDYVLKLLDIDAQEEQLINQSEEYREYIAQRVLFIRSGTWPKNKDAIHILEAARWMVSPQNWLQPLPEFARTIYLRSYLYLISLPLILIPLFFRRRFALRIIEFSEIAAKKSCVLFAPTVKAFALSILIALPIPLILYLIGYAYNDSYINSTHSLSVGKAFIVLGGVLLPIMCFYELLCPKGVIDLHFAWAQDICLETRKLLVKIVPFILVSIFVMACVEFSANEDWKESLGRLAFIIFAIICQYNVWLIYKGPSNLMDKILSRIYFGKVQGIKVVIKLLIFICPILLILASVSGYYYTALRFGVNLYLTDSCLLVAIIAAGLANRWILLTRRKLGREQAQKKRALLKAQQNSTSSESKPIVEDELLDLELVDVQASRLVYGTTIVAILVSVWFIWGNMLPALDILNKFTIGHTIEYISETKVDTEGVEYLDTTEREVPITLKHLFMSVLIAMLTVVATKNIPGILELTILQRLKLPAGERYAITSIVRYVIVGLGIALTFNAVGIGWARVQWLIAALSLGLGFGLQEIFANFVSGLILLFERPIRIGDTVTVGGVSGTVTRIRFRATTITDFDRKELIVPNKEFITAQLVNWTLSDPILRVTIPVGVSYESDVEDVEKALLEIAAAHPMVLKDPEPKGYFLGFGDSTLNFELRVHCSGIDDYVLIKHFMHMEIMKSFREKGIEIAFPQRDLHIRSSDVEFVEKKKKP